MPGAEDHGHVPVVTAGVHDPVVPGPVRPVAAFGERQAVHVGAQGDGVAVACVVASAEAGDQAGAADVASQVEAHGLQLGGQVVAGAVLPQAGLRDLVQRMAPAAQPRRQVPAHAVGSVWTGSARTTKIIAVGQLGGEEGRAVIGGPHHLPTFYRAAGCRRAACERPSNPATMILDEHGPIRARRVMSGEQEERRWQARTSPPRAKGSC
jgi:hypothetical protein